LRWVSSGWCRLPLERGRDLTNEHGLSPSSVYLIAAFNVSLHSFAAMVTLVASQPGRAPSPREQSAMLCVRRGGEPRTPGEQAGAGRRPKSPRLTWTSYEIGSLYPHYVRGRRLHIRGRNSSDSNTSLTDYFFPSLAIAKPSCTRLSDVGSAPRMGSCNGRPKYLEKMAAGSASRPVTLYCRSIAHVSG
jgi:hypothetical protein